jgi:hypothetical protein
MSFAKGTKDFFLFAVLLHKSILALGLLLLSIPFYFFNRVGIVLISTLYVTYVEHKKNEKEYSSICIIFR